MIQLENTAVQSLPARRVSAEEFCDLARQTKSSVYRPRWEVLRMLAVGEAWGAAAPDGTLEAALLVLPLEADVSLAAGLRALEGGLPARGFLLTPPAGAPEYLPALLKAAKNAAVRRAPPSPVRAVLEWGIGSPQAQTLETYFSQGFALRALRPLQTMAPLALLTSAPVNTRGQEVWVPLEDATHLALLLARGWAAVGSRGERGNTALRLVSLHG
ncbi:MAG: hypothetical protein LKJ90_08455 [Faecalibacterium sp.]|jgi:hypothetical protein|nr:hypothetical protein [Faecalibacterium sp.]